MIEKVLNRFITVKSVVTLILTGIFAYLSAIGSIPPDAFQDIFYIVIAFYFGSSLERKAQAVGAETE